MKRKTPFDRRRAVGSKWTSCRPEGRERHFELVALKQDEAELRCVVSRDTRWVPIEQLRDPERWQAGWMND